jgi:hypothetical protein
MARQNFYTCYLFDLLQYGEHRVSCFHDAQKDFDVDLEETSSSNFVSFFEIFLDDQQVAFAFYVGGDPIGLVNVIEEILRVVFDFTAIETNHKKPQNGTRAEKQQSECLRCNSLVECFNEMLINFLIQLLNFTS